MRHHVGSLGGKRGASVAGGWVLPAATREGFPPSGPLPLDQPKPLAGANTRSDVPAFFGSNRVRKNFSESAGSEPGTDKRGPLGGPLQ